MDIEAYGLLEELDLQVATLASIHNGCFSVSCSNCSDSMKKDGKCLIYHKIDDFTYDEEVMVCKELGILYYNCPISIIHGVITDLYDDYNFTDEFNTSYTPDELSSIKWWFRKTYKRYTNEIKLAIHEAEAKKNKKR